MDIMTLAQKYQTWAVNTITEARVQNQELGYSFIANTIGYQGEDGEDNTFTIQGLLDFFDRKDLNKEYVQNYQATFGTAESGPVAGNERKSYAWQQNEINMIYSFHKCFATRHHTRLEYYRKDLSQKGARTMSAINVALGVFQYKKDAADRRSDSLAGPDSSDGGPATGAA